MYLNLYAEWHVTCIVLVRTYVYMYMYVYYMCMCHVIVCRCMHALQLHTCTHSIASHRSVHKPSRSRQDAGRKAVPGERICGDVLRRRPDGDLVLRQLPESQPRRVYSLRRPGQSKRPGLQPVVLAQSHLEQDILCLSHRPVSGESDFCTKFLY